jgi:hypothetical protein
VLSSCLFFSGNFCSYSNFDPTVVRGDAKGGGLGMHPRRNTALPPGSSVSRRLGGHSIASTSWH